MAYNPFYDDGLHHQGPPRVAFSRTELVHLLGALVLLTVSFTFVMDGRPWREVVTAPDPVVWLTSFVGMASGFVLHELAHKVVAQRYGHWAEFRASFPFLGLTVALAAAFRLLFAAPGAVLIQGRVTPRENGLISLVGPGLNVAVALLCFGAYMVGFRLSPTWGIDGRDVAPFMLSWIARVNALLGVFNLVPIRPLDGSKVLRWSKGVYALAITASLALFLAVLYQTA